MSDTQTPGTEAVATPAGGTSEPQPTPATEPDNLQTRYEALLERLTTMEQGKQQAETRASELERLITERLEPQRSTTAQPDDVSSDIAAFEQQLQFTMTNSQDQSERRAAAWMLGLAAHVRGLPSQFSEQVALAPLPQDVRQQVQQVMKEATQSGNRITPEFARQIVDYRSAQAELAKLRATPPPQPPNTRVVPSPMPAPQMATPDGFGNAWGAATPEQRDQMFNDFRTGKFHLKPS